MFRPHPFLAHSLSQTLAPSLFPPRAGFLPFPLPTRRVRLALEGGDETILLEDSPEADLKDVRPANGLCYLLVGGLGSHARVPNLERLARKLVSYGHPVWRLNHRGTGEGEGLARGIYHAARIEDLHAAVGLVANRAPQCRIVLVGYSLSGNMALRYVGEWADRISRQLLGVVAASPVLDLAANAPCIPHAAKGFYNWNFLRELRRTVRTRHAHFPELGHAGLPRRLTLPDFDAIYTAPHAGFDSREAYYATASSIPWLARIRVRAHVISSRDDPFSQADPRAFPNAVTATVTDTGGHHGFFAAKKGVTGDRFWLDDEILRTAEGWAR